MCNKYLFVKYHFKNKIIKLQTFIQNSYFYKRN